VRIPHAGRSIVNNVEYSEVEGFLGGKGEPVDAAGESAYPGNTNQFVVKIAAYAKCLEASEGQVPEFVNPKYSDDKRLAFASPTRLESMMQDLPRLFTHPDASVSFVKMERFFSYTPVKNGVKQGAALADKGLPPMTPSSGEADLYAANRELLRLAGMQVADAAPMMLNGMSIVPGPRVVLAPSFALGVGDVLHKVRGGSLSGRSTLTVHGQDILIENLSLDGTLIVRAVPGVACVCAGARLCALG
jgi:UDP-sugar pyrophosphorylase